MRERESFLEVVDAATEQLVEARRTVEQLDRLWRQGLSPTSPEAGEVLDAARKTVGTARYARNRLRVRREPDSPIVTAFMEALDAVNRYRSQLEGFVKGEAYSRSQARILEERKSANEAQDAFMLRAQEELAAELVELDQEQQHRIRWLRCTRK